MFKNIDYKVFKHSNYNLVFTLIVKTFMYEKYLSNNVKKELEKIAYNIFENRNNCLVRDITIENETTIIIIFESKPNINLSNLIGNFKTVSSRKIRQRFNFDKNLWEQKYYLYTNNP